MIRYETLILASPEIVSQEEEQLQRMYFDVIKDFGGQLVSFERWGKFRLAYPVEGNDYGVYFLARFEVEGEVEEAKLVKAIRDLFAIKLTKNILRNMTSRLDVKKGLSYSRPESLEEQPTEHHSVKSHEAKSEKKEADVVVNNSSSSEEAQA